MAGGGGDEVEAARWRATPQDVANDGPALGCPDGESSTGDG